MFRSSVERQLRQNADKLRRAREELGVVGEQLEALAHEADDARLRSLVSETPLAGAEATTAGRHVSAMKSRRDELVSSIESMEQRQDELLDRLSGSRR